MHEMSRDEWRAFLLDGDDLVFTTHETSVKGTTTVHTDLGELRERATRIGARYMGTDRANDHGARNGVPGELLVRVTPGKVLARAGITD
jgi:hypothetical protein